MSLSHQDLHAWIAGFALWSGLGTSLLGVLFLFALRARQPTLWRDLGRPWFWPLPAEPNSRSFYSWLKTGGYREVTDPWVRWPASLANLLAVAFLLSFFGLALVNLLWRGE